MQPITINKTTVENLEELIDALNPRLEELSRRIEMGSSNLDKSIKTVLGDLAQIKTKINNLPTKDDMKGFVTKDDFNEFKNEIIELLPNGK